MISPPVELRGCAASPGARAAPRPVDSRRASQRKKSQITNRPARISQTVGERPDHDGPPGFGWIQPHSPERSTPKTSSAEPERRQHRADHVEVRARAPTGASAIRRGRSEDDEHEHDLAGEHPAPGEVGRAEAADQRPDRDRDRAGRGDQAVGGRAALGREVAGDERDDRRQDQRGADALEERPAEQQHRQARRERGRERPARRRSRSRSRTPACGR